MSAPDKLSNIGNIVADYRQLGEDLWGRFKADPLAWQAVPRDAIVVANNFDLVPGEG